MLQVAITIEPSTISPIQNLGLFTGNIAQTILILAAVAAFLYFIIGGLKWILAGGDTNKIEEARNQITNALIGLTIAAAAWAIFLLADHFFGLNIANNSSSGSSASSGSGANYCACSNGGCATTGQLGSLNGKCYECTESGWKLDQNTPSCPPINCGPCSN